jgi:hypothetical protein
VVTGQKKKSEVLEKVAKSPFLTILILLYNPIRVDEGYISLIYKSQGTFLLKIYQAL